MTSWAKARPLNESHQAEANDNGEVVVKMCVSAGSVCIPVHACGHSTAHAGGGRDERERVNKSRVKGGRHPC